MKKINLLFIVIFLSGCSVMKDFEQSDDENSSKITVERALSAPLLGSSTFIYATNNKRNCKGDSSGNDTKFMVLDKLNPLVSEYNENGVFVENGKELSLLFQSVAELRQCTIIATFTPESASNYHIVLRGRIGSILDYCEAVLYRVNKISKKPVADKFSVYQSCET
ncbi:hypothetical protein [Endozoicomonas elysicola]|uniref:Lipoprotein n=1 Tax=Endozoicomonas elysicola TaxID=305900 RepID=A0A081KAV2_9GAMM|nr:hypothetical protein [Endozoicomonas elysicola]KEI71278.1 hypothetical protein GV64_11470 [Endozoicomonas elysicola]